MQDNIEKEDNKDLVFKVQIGTYLKSMKRDKLFIKIKAQENLVNGTFKYYVGLEKNKNAAENIRNQMLELGFKGAFIVAFYKEERISIKEALNLQNKLLKNE